MTKRRCDLCEWCHKQTWLDGNKEERHMLQCRRRPPELTLKNEEEAYSVWPIMMANDWCGEFTLRNAVAPEEAPTQPSMKMAHVELQAIHTALKAATGNREYAARLLGIGTRTLYRKIRKYGLHKVNYADDRVGEFQAKTGEE